MAKKKTHRKKHSRRRHSMGAAGAVNKIAGIAAGAVAAQVLAKFLPIENEKYKAGIQVAAGVVFPKVMKGALGEALGAGMIAAGAVNLAKSFNIGGIGEDDSQLALPVSVGADDLSLISGEGSYNESVLAGEELSVIAGMEDF